MKSIFMSKTFWVNAVILIAATVDQILASGIIPADATGIIQLLTSVNIGFRAITSKGVTIIPQ